MVENNVCLQLTMQTSVCNNRLSRFLYIFFLFFSLFEAATWGSAAASAASLQPPCYALKHWRCAEVSLTGTSQASGRILGPQQRMRCQLHIFTPPLAHCTSLKPEAACSGFISVPAHTGGIGGAPHADLSLAVFVSAFCLCRERGREGAREGGRDGSETRFTHV